MKKKKVGILYGRPLIEGDVNYIKSPEILVRCENKSITLAERGGRGMKSISDQSSAEDRYGDIKLAINAVTYTVTIDSYSNPKTLKEVFSFVPSVMYDSSVGLDISEQGLIAGSVSLLSSLVYAMQDELSLTPINVWIGTEDIPDKIKELKVQIIATKALNFKYLLPVWYIDVPYAAFQNGHLKGIWSSIQNNYYGSNTLQGSYIFYDTNYKGEEVEDSFAIMGTMNNANVIIPVTPDENYIQAYRPYLIVSPLVDGLFTIAVHKETDTLVLVKCLDMDMSYYRNLLNIPESMVIPCKEGEYIEYPNIQEATTDAIMTTDLPDTDSSNEKKEAMLKALEQMVESLNASIKRLKGEEG